MTKKIFAISTLVLILLVGAIFVYNFAFKKTTPQIAAPKTSDEGKTTTAPPVNQNTAKSTGGSIAAISDSPVFGATLAPDGNTLYYFSGENGQLNQVDLNGKLEKVISTEEFQNIENILWNETKNQAIIKRAIGANESKFILLDLAQKTVTPLKDNIDSIAWSDSGTWIFYKYYDSKTKKRTINLSNPNGANWRKIADTDYFAVSINSVPGSPDLSFWPSPDAFVASAADTINFSGENKKEILKDRFGTDLLWSPNGSTAAVSYTDVKGGKKTDLALMNSDGGQFQSMNFPTFAKKCTWSADSKFLFCAMPGNVPESAILPNDWQDGKVETSDTFWKIEAATGKRERLIDPEKINGSYDIISPFLSQDGKILFFTNKVDGKLYKLGL